MNQTIHKITMLMIVFVIFVVVLAVIGSAITWYIERGFGVQMAGMLLIGGLLAFGVIVGAFLMMYGNNQAQSAMVDGMMTYGESMSNMTRYNARENAMIAKMMGNQQKALDTAYMTGLRTRQKALPAPVRYEDEDEEAPVAVTWRSQLKHGQYGDDEGVEI